MTASKPPQIVWGDEYHALVSRCGLVDLAKRTQIEIGGADGAAFLHNLCTHDIRKLRVGAGCEAFLTNVRGKTLAHVFAFVGPESIVLSTVPGQGEKLIAHLDHYLVSERVTLADRSDAWREIFLGGPGSAKLLAGFVDALPPARLDHRQGTVAGQPVFVRRADLAGPDGFLISLSESAVDAVCAALRKAGAVAGGAAAFEAARIEWGFPLFGRDISEENLPQEVARDRLAISFTKGCYLGQETVARIDALGHVNRLLVGLKFTGEQIPPAGADLTAEGHSVGQVTSSSYSPRLAASIGLGYVRRGHHAPGTSLDSAAAAAEVVALPFA